MQENNFEKQVQQKMEELSFTPSAPVWQKVELQIRKDKQRRRMVLWLFPLLLLGGAAVWFAIQPLQHRDMAHKENLNKKMLPHQQQTTTKGNETIDANRNKTTVPAIESKEAVVTTKENNNTSIDKLEQGPSQITAATNKQKIKNKEIKEKAWPKKTSVHTKNVAAVNKTKTLIEQPASSTAIITNDKKEVAKAETEVPVAATKATDDENNLTTETTIKQDSSVVLPEVKEESVPLPAKKKAANTKWRWEVKAVAGMSNQVVGIMNNVMGLESNRDVFASPANNSGGGIGMGNGGSGGANMGGTVVYPSQPTKGFAYVIGGTIKRSAGKRSFIVASLQYSYYSTKLMVGTYVVDSAVALSNNRVLESNYYRNNNSRSSYTNRYHFIEIPISFEYQLFKAVPLHLRHGLSVGYLIGSNAMHYDNRANIYYKNNDLLHKGSINLFSSADYRFMKSSSFTLFAGPQLQYNLRTVNKNTVNNGGHLFSAGLVTRISF